jgi:hypothetical protein
MSPLVWRICPLQGFSDTGLSPVQTAVLSLTVELRDLAALVAVEADEAVAPAGKRLDRSADERRLRHARRGPVEQAHEPPADEPLPALGQPAVGVQRQAGVASLIARTHASTSTRVSAVRSETGTPATVGSPSITVGRVSRASSSNAASSPSATRRPTAG